MPDIAQWYAAQRGSPVFVFGLIVFVAGWILLDHLTGFDQDFGVLNLCLSTEASVSLAFFTMMGDRQTVETQRSMQALANTIDEVRAMEKVLLALAEAERDQLAAK